MVDSDYPDESVTLTENMSLVQWLFDQIVMSHPLVQKAFNWKSLI